ncbi:MAG: hypothetical protein IPK53_03645 [bacterium]|nr:hypothetical protein [bacterium]
MGSLSDFGENAVLGMFLGVAYTPPATVYLGLSTADPLDTAAGLAEPSYTGYARKAITFGAAAAGRVTQSATVTFDQCTAGTATVTHWALFDASTAGNMLAHGALAVSKNIVAGNTPSVASGQVYVEITGEFGQSAVHSALNRMFRNQAWTLPSSWYVALTTVAVTSTDTGSTITEPSGNAYARTTVGASPWAAVSGGASQNNNLIQFPTPTGTWGTVVGMAVVDAASAGNVLFFDNDMTDQAVGTSDDVSFAIGALDVSLT